MSTISILGGTQALAYEFETRLAELKAADLVDELFDELEQNPNSPEVLTAELLALDAGAAKIDTAELFEPLSAWEKPDDCLAVSYFACGDQPFAAPASPNQELSPSSVEASLPKPASAGQADKASADKASKVGINHRILAGITAASLIGVGGLISLLIAQLSGSKPVPVAATAPAAPVSVDPATVAFAKYLDQSLERLGQQVASQPAANPNSAHGNVPMVGTNTPGQPIERVYVPIYQGQAAPQAPSVPVAAAPTVPAQIPGAPRTAVTLPPPPAARIPASVQSYLPNSTNPVRRPSRRPTSMAAVSTANPATPAPVGNNTLIGVLELGDRSVAMVEVNGAAQRVGIGQTLDSGWQLMQIADQKAVLQRGGEVRSLSVGQTF
jgi:hypothetical protein